MYRVAVRRNFIAQHALIGGDWGAENQKHSHAYVLEVELAGDRLDEHGYLLDITEIEASLKEQVLRYQDAFLNELPEFVGLNPSLENFARILCVRLTQELHSPGVRRVTVRLWENESAWAGYELER